MAYYTDDDATPRPFRGVIPDEWDARTPYIPRRKSSHSQGLMHPASMTNITRLLRAEQDQNTAQDYPGQKARFPIDGYDPPLDQALHQIPLQRGPELRRPLSTFKQSSSRRFLNRLFSNLPFPSNASRPQSIHSNASDSRLDRTQCRSGSMASSGASSTPSRSTVASSSRGNTVRRRRQLALTSFRTIISDNSNPLRVPPPSLLGPTRDNSAGSEATGPNSSPMDSREGFLHTPTVAYGQLRYLTLVGDNSPKNCSFWVILDVLCGLNPSINQEPLGPGPHTNKFFNNPGLLKGVGLALYPLQNCQITAVFGQCTATMLTPGQTLTVIILVTLHRSLLPPTRLSPLKENGKPSPSASRRRPTSDVLNDELLNQLLGKFKRTAQSKDEKMEEGILRAVATYEHSLFPPEYVISHEQTVSVERARICTRPHGSLQKYEQNRERDSLHRSAVERLTTQEIQDAGEKIARVLREGLRLDGSVAEAASHLIIDARQAVKFLNDFFAVATRLAPDTNRTLEMLKFQYAVLISSSGRTAAHHLPSAKRYNPFDRRGDERNKNSEPKSPRHAPTTRSKESRRNAFEIDREEVKLERGLADITNQTRHGTYDVVSGGTRLLGHDEKGDIGRHDVIPAPLFSPRRGLTLGPSPVANSPIYSSTTAPEEEGFYGCRQHLTAQIGSASFYEAEVEQMARQAFGGPTAACRHGSEMFHQFAETNEVVGACNDAIEEDGNDQAKMIWEKMRINSKGSKTIANGTEASCHDERGDNAERASEYKVLSTPWLA